MSDPIELFNCVTCGNQNILMPDDPPDVRCEFPDGKGNRHLLRIKEGDMVAQINIKELHPETRKKLGIDKDAVLPPVPPRPDTAGMSIKTAGMAIHDYYEANAPEIIADDQKIGSSAAMKRWGFSYSGWENFRRRHGMPVAESRGGRKKKEVKPKQHEQKSKRSHPGGYSADMKRETPPPTAPSADAPPPLPPPALPPAEASEKVKEVNMQKIKLLQAMFGEAYADEYGRNGYVPKDIDLDWALSTLKTREKFVIENLFADKPMTLNEVGKIFPKCNGQRGVSRERIRQIKSNALNKLRHPSRSDRLWPNHPKPALPPAEASEKVKELNRLRLAGLPKFRWFWWPKTQVKWLEVYERLVAGK